MKTVLGVKRRVWGFHGGFEQLRGLPLTEWNIQNTLNIYKNIYKKQIDKQYHLIVLNQNIAEYTGTLFVCLFRKCSGHVISLNVAVALMNQGFQPIHGNTCSGMFRLWIQHDQQPERQQNRASQPFHL